MSSKDSMLPPRTNGIAQGEYAISLVKIIISVFSSFFSYVG